MERKPIFCNPVSLKFRDRRYSYRPVFHHSFALWSLLWKRLAYLCVDRTSKPTLGMLVGHRLSVQASFPAARRPGDHWPVHSFFRGAQMWLRRLNHEQRETWRIAARARKQKTVLFTACAVWPKQRRLLVLSVLSPSRVGPWGAEPRCKGQACPESRGACA